MPDPFAAFRSTPEEFWGRYKKWQDLVVGHFVSAAERSGMDKAQAEAIIRTAPSNDVLFQAMPYDTAKKLQSAYREDVLRLSDDYITQSWHRVGRGGNDKDVGRFVPRGSAKKSIGEHPLAYTLRRMSFQRDPSIEGVEGISFGGNIPRYEHLKNLYEGRHTPITAGKKVFVFDTETLGLATDASNVRQVAGLTMQRTAQGFNIDPASIMTSNMNVSRAAFGSIRDPVTGKVVRMDDYIRKSINGGTSFEHMPGGKGFIEGVLPTLQQMNDADFIAGHNVGFDIGQVITNAMKTSDYLNNRVVNGVNVKSVVDSVANKIGKGAVIDSLNMASEYFGNNLSLAPEFKAIGKVGPFSLENILLQTNLSQLIKQDNPEFYSRFLLQGQHAADVDTTITAKLIEAMTNKTLRAGMMDDPALRRNVLHSYALTPISNITDPSHITKELFRQLHAEQDPRTLSIHTFGKEGTVPLGDLSADEWYSKLIDKDSSVFASMRVTPMEQHIFEGQRLFDAVPDPESLIPGLGQWARYSRFNVRDQGFLNRIQNLFKGGVIPDDASFGSFQKQMAKAGMPFAGLSLEERILTSGIAAAGKRRSTLRGILSDRELRAVDYGDDLGIGRFSMRDKFLNAYSGPGVVPLDILKEAESQGIIGTSFLGDQVQMLSLSTVEGKKNLNLMLDLSKSDTEQLMDWMGGILKGDVANPVLRQRLIEKGLNLDLFESMRASLLDEGNFARGINIGVLEGDAGTQAYTVLSDLLQGATRDSSKIPFRVGYMSDEVLGDKGGGVIRTGAAILDRFKDDKIRAGYRRDLHIAQNRVTQLTEELSDPIKRLRAGLNAYNNADRIAAKSDQIYELLTKRAPVVAGAAGLVFGGYYLHKRREKQKTYDEAFEQMPAQDQGDYDDYRRSMGMSYAPAKRRLDPLSTAGLVGNLHNAAIGHAVMGSLKNNGLFSSI